MRTGTRGALNTSASSPIFFFFSIWEVPSSQHWQKAASWLCDLSFWEDFMPGLMFFPDSLEILYFSLKIFFICTIIKVFIEFVTILLLIYILVFWPRAMWDLSYPIRDWSCTPASGGDVLTTEPPGKSHFNMGPHKWCSKFCWLDWVTQWLTMIKA